MLLPFPLKCIAIACYSVLASLVVEDRGTSLLSLYDISVFAPGMSFPQGFCPVLSGKRLLMTWASYSFLTILQQWKDSSLLSPGTMSLHLSPGAAGVFVFLTTLGSFSIGETDLGRLSGFSYSDSPHLPSFAPWGGLPPVSFSVFRCSHCTWWIFLDKSLWLDVDSPVFSAPRGSMLLC